MELFKFVSNIEISFMPGELIIEVYRRMRKTSYAWDSTGTGLQRTVAKGEGKE